MKSLRESAIDAYNASPLKQMDDEHNAGSIETIKRFLGLFGFEKEIDSNPVKIEDLNFYAAPTIDQGGPYGYMLKVSRLCASCKDNIVFEMHDINFDDFDIAEFGKCLRDPHLCEFETLRRLDSKMGFINSI